jgi:hypothetical protein
MADGRERECDGPGGFDQTDAALSEALARHPLSGEAVIRLLNDIDSEDERRRREAILRGTFPHPDDDDAGEGDANHTSLGVARSLPPDGDDDDEGAEPAWAEHAATVGLIPRVPPHPGSDPLDYLRHRLAVEASAYRSWVRVGREVERTAHVLLERMFKALVVAARDDDGLDSVGRLVELVEAVAHAEPLAPPDGEGEGVPAPSGRFYSETVSAYRHQVEDRDTVTCLCSSTFADIAEMVAAYLDGNEGEARAARLAVLDRLDHPGVIRGGGA